MTTAPRNVEKPHWFHSLTESLKEWIRREIVDDDPYDNETFDDLIGHCTDPSASSKQ